MEKEDVKNLTQEYMAKLGLAPEEIARWKIFFRKKRRNIATCRPKSKKIIYNSKLLNLNEEFWRGVVAHEVAHIREKRHNQRFKQLAKSLEPEAAFAGNRLVRIECFLPENISLALGMFEER